MRFFINISFVGTGYHGWQTQHNAGNTVQAVCNAALSRILKHPVSLTGCGRTDAGVHAREFYAHFDTDVIIHPTDKVKWLYKFNSVLPFSIAVNDIMQVKPDANARFDALSRTYSYLITERKDPFLQGFAHFIPWSPDIKAMNKAAGKLKHYKEFSSFKKSHTQNKTDTCVIHRAAWKEEGDRLTFTVTANRFLRNMVRSMTGTMLAVGKGTCSVDDFCRIIESKNRSQAGVSVPACGLYLVKVEYPEDIFE